MNRDVLLACVAAILMAGLVLFAFLHGADLSVLNPKGPVAFAERHIMWITVLLSSIVVLPVFGLLFFFGWKYRANSLKAQAKHAPNWDHDNWAAETIWWIIPTVIIVWLGIMAWQSAHALDPWKPLVSDVPAVEVDVVALDWKWLFIYPAQGIASENLLEFPAGTPISFKITADAPMNQFWIPSLGGQVMAMPGMTTELHLSANAPGVFRGLSSNLSGEGFSGMSFAAKAVTPEEFAAWVARVKETQAPLSSTTYAALAKPARDASVSTFYPVDPSLYDGVVNHYMEMPAMPSTP